MDKYLPVNTSVKEHNRYIDSIMSSSTCCTTTYTPEQKKEYGIPLNEPKTLWRKFWDFINKII